MSSLIVEVVKIDEIQKHPNADALDLAIVKGWQSVVKKDSFKAGDLAVYFPLDSVLPQELSDVIGVTNYLSNGRVRAAKLRGESSFGLLWNVTNAEEYTSSKLPIETNVAEILGITKWVPPENYNVADAETPHPEFFGYTDIENFRNYTDIITEEDEVILTEKIHGTNARHAFIESTFMAGGHNVRFKENDKNKFWHVFSEDMKQMLKSLSDNGTKNVIMYGEVFGSGVQDLTYGFDKGKIGYRCFDISVNGIYLGYTDWFLACQKFNIPMVPVLYRGKFSLSEVLKWETKSQLADNMMEGVVIRLVNEKRSQKIGRIILKYVFDQYLNRKGGSEFR